MMKEIMRKNKKKQKKDPFKQRTRRKQSEEEKKPRKKWLKVGRKKQMRKEKGEKTILDT
jgi:hypothetical protein